MGARAYIDDDDGPATEPADTIEAIERDLIRHTSGTPNATAGSVDDEDDDVAPPPPPTASEATQALDTVRAD